MLQRILGLDIGDKRIGIAASDLLGITAQGIEVYERTNTLSEDIDYILELVKKLNAESIVVGLPKNMDGTLGFQAERVREFADALSAGFSGSVLFVDERRTTISAHNALSEMNVRGKKRKGAVDKIAASIILQSYLDTYRR